MRFRIAAQPGYLRADVESIHTGGETQEFLKAVAKEAKQQRLSALLIGVKDSAAIFRVGSFRLSAWLYAARWARLRIALTADKSDIRLSHQYIELLAQQIGANVKAFDCESTAIDWLTYRYPEQAPSLPQGDLSTEEHASESIA